MTSKKEQWEKTQHLIDELNKPPKVSEELLNKINSFVKETSLLPAQQAKEIAQKSDSGLIELLEELSDLITEEAQQQRYSLEYLLPDVEPKLIEEFIKEIEKAGYTVKKIQIVLSDDYGTILEPGIKVSWRWA